ncbi:hypothetical protein D3C72_2357350 [compost metagenome]
MPPTASRISPTAYVKGMNGFSIWKKGPAVLTGKVPPELENWSTMKTIAIPLPILPNTETSA